MAASVIRHSTDAAWNITGLTGGSDGRILYLHNVGSFDFTLKDESASSSAANRFALTGDVTLTPDSLVMLQYDSTSSRWRCLSPGSGGGSTLPVADTQTIVKGSADATKLLRFEVDGLTTGTTRVLTPQDADYTIENTVHASKHVSGGSDSIKLDDLAAPDDNTDLNATTTAHGLLKKLSNSSTEFMNGVGNWATPAGTLDINGLTQAYLDSASDYIPYYSATATANRKFVPGRLAEQIPTAIHGRLSTESGVASSSSDRTNQSTLYWVGDKFLPCQDANGWVFAAAPGSLTLSGMTAGKNYDVFFDSTNGLDLAPAWTNDTTRATGISLVDGLWVNTSTFTSVIDSLSYTANYAIYLGTIRANDATTIDDSEANRHLWNLYNRRRRPVRKFETTDSWTYGTATWRQLNNSATNQISIVCGIAGESCLHLAAHAYAGSTVIGGMFTAIGEDATTGPAASSFPRSLYISVATGFASGIAELSKLPALGRHYYPMLERSNVGSGTQTWYGDAGGAGLVQSGLQGVWDC